MATGMGNAMGVVERVARAIAAETNPNQLADLRGHADLELSRQSPWRREAAVGEVVARLVGLGPIQHLVDDPEVSDVVVNGYSEVWADRGTGLVRQDVGFLSDADLVATIERAIAPLGLRIDRNSPTVDARLPDGSRLHAVLPPASVNRTLVAIRRFTQRVVELDDLIEAGTATADQVRLMRNLVEERKTIVVSGGTGAGKTTLLNLLAQSFDPSDRTITIEDAAELDFPGHVVRLEARTANAEGAGEITMRKLLRSALRLRPDRIVVGEVRGPEALDLIMALNTGHQGSLTTVHANSPEEALLRLESLALMEGNFSRDTIAAQLRAAVDYVVQIQRTGLQRVITAISEAK